MVGVDPDSGEEVRVATFNLPQMTGVTTATAISGGYRALRLDPWVG